MLLAVDIGNTAVTLGVFETARPVEGDGGLAEPLWRRRLATSGESSPEGWSGAVEGVLSEAGMGAGDVDSAMVCSVVPGVEAAFSAALRALFGSPPLVLSDGQAAGRAARMGVLTDDPAEVGADRVVAAAAAYAVYGGPVIVVDSGTALTVDYVDGDGNYLGGAIAPGVETSSAALIEKAARLAPVELRRPERAVGRSTDEALRSGAYYGFSGLVDRIVEKMEAEEGRAATVVATGGGAGLVAGGSDRIGVVDESLVLKGLLLIYGKGRY